MDYSTAYFDSDIMDKTVYETNRYCEFMSNTNFSSKSHVCFALLIPTPHCKKHVLNDYGKHDPLIATPIIGKYMPRDRFLAILRFLHFADSEHPAENDRLWKKKIVFEMLKKNAPNIFTPSVTL